MLVTIRDKKFEVKNFGNGFLLTSRGDINPRYFWTGKDEVIDFIHLMNYVDNEEWNDVHSDLIFTIKYRGEDSIKQEFDKLIGGATRLNEELSKKFAEYEAALAAKNAAQESITPKEPPEIEPDPLLNQFLEEDDGVDVDIELADPEAPPPFSMRRYLARKALEYLPAALLVVAAVSINGWVAAKFVARELQAQTKIEAAGHQKGAEPAASAPKQ